MTEDELRYKIDHEHYPLARLVYDYNEGNISEELFEFGLILFGIL